MLDKTLAEELTGIAVKQLEEGIDAKMERMEVVREYIDLDNNKTITLDDGVYDAPFPFFSNLIDTFQSKIDNKPNLRFKVPNKATFSDKIQAAWEAESSSTRAGWARKDLVEKDQALLSGRAISKVYASSVMNKYESHYDIVDVFSFVCDPTRGMLEDQQYHGETDIFKTHKALELGAENGFYDKDQVDILKSIDQDEKDGNAEIVKNKYDRLRALGVNPEKLSHVGQKGALLTEWIMSYEEEMYYLLFEPNSKTWVRAELLKDVFANGKTPYTSWATHYDEYNFWSKSIGDDVAPVTESMRFLVNNAIENERRNVRPQRMLESGALVDVNQLQDYIPDDVLLINKGQNPNLITIDAPGATGTINLVEYLDKSSQTHMGLQGAGVDEKDAKVGIFFGQLQQEADRIGIINKQYSDSYSYKGYNFFWGLKQHLTKPKQVEMLGKHGMKLQQLAQFDFKDVDDVDDVLVSGGSAQDELDAVERENRQKVLAELTGAYPDKLNASWVIRNSLKGVNFEEDDVQEALDIEGSINRELMEEADQAIQEILLGQHPRLNNGADVAFLQRIQDFVINELDYVKLDAKGKESGIDKKKKQQSVDLLAYMKAHQEIVIDNNLRKAREVEFEKQAAGILAPPDEAQKSVELPVPSEQEQQLASARPFEGNIASPAGAASAAQGISQTLTP